jgi:hypothetical protein
MNRKYLCLDYSSTKIIQFSLLPTDSVILDQAVLSYALMQLV